MKNSREIVVDILQQVFGEEGYSNIVLSKKLNHSSLDERDKALVTEITYGTIKFKYSIDKILNNYIKDISRAQLFILNILRMSVYQIVYMDKIPEFAIINEAVNIAKRSSLGESKFVNGVLRNILRSKKYTMESKDFVENLCLKYSFEPWMVKLFIKQYGMADCEKILAGLNQVPDVTVRVNTLKASSEDIKKKLLENGYNIEKGCICDEAVRIIKGRSIERNPLFKDGYISVQDESAMLVAKSMSIEKNINVLDLCSAPGGKTAHISELMRNTGEVHAYDIHENKISLIQKNMERLGIDNVQCKVMDASNFDDKLVNIGDRVLIDVPCSGLGIIRKKPEIKWTKSIKKLDSLIGIQRDILKNAAQYTKKDGILLYSTCTLNKKENEENIKWFLNNFPSFKIEPLNYGEFDNIIYHNEGFVTILPNKTMDGFFIAKMRKQW